MGQGHGAPGDGLGHIAGGVSVQQGGENAGAAWLRKQSTESVSTADVDATFLSCRRARKKERARFAGGRALKYGDRTRQVLAEKSYFASAKSIGGRITERHGRKLGKRMFDDKAQAKWVKSGKGNDQVSRKAAAALARMVRDVEPSYIDPTDAKSVNTAFGSKGNVYILHSQFKQEGRHVEEKFMDMLATSGHTGRTIVGGKMRPCLTCSGRMQHMNDQGHDVAFGQEPGKVWKGRYDAQPSEVRKVTAGLAKNKFTFKSTAGWSFGPESDSEGE